MRERGQTQYDYLVGITVLLLTLSGVFLFVPGIYQPFQDPVDPTDRTVTQRLADTLVQQTVLPGTSRTLNATALDQSLRTDWSATRTGANVRSYLDLNVSVIDNGDNNIVVAGGDPYVAEASAAATVRIVRFENGSQCDPTCRLVVRAWSDD
jgi:hypothetical protein